MINEVKQLVKKSIETRKNITESLNNNETALSKNEAQLSKVETLIKEAMDLTRATNSAENKANKGVYQHELSYMLDEKIIPLLTRYKDVLKKLFLNGEYKVSGEDLKNIIYDIGIINEIIEELMDEEEVE